MDEYLPLQGKRIGISISNSEELVSLGFSYMHIQDLMVELARYLLIQGATLIYGGDLRAGGYTEIFSQLALWYKDLQKKDEEPRIENYFPWPTHVNVKRSVWREWKRNRIKPILLDPPNDLHLDKDKYINLETVEDRYIWSKSLTYMREQITTTCNARVILGGHTSGYLGRMPGLLEEAILTVNDDKPVYIIGAFGGVSSHIANVLQNKDSQALTLKYQLSSDKNNNYLEFYDFLKQRDAKYMVDYVSLIKKLAEFGLEGLSENNGLSQLENQKLFTSTHIQEIIYLILKGSSKKLATSN